MKNSPDFITFGYSEKQLRTHIDENNDPWFVAKDVFNILGLTWKGSNPSLKGIPEEWRGVCYYETPLENQYGKQGEQKQNLVIINQAAVFKLAFRSRKEEAEKFTNWVAGEVLPQLLNKGSYSLNKNMQDDYRIIRYIDQRVKHIAQFAWAMHKQVEEELFLDYKAEIGMQMIEQLNQKLQLLGSYLIGFCSPDRNSKYPDALPDAGSF